MTEEEHQRLHTQGIAHSEAHPLWETQPHPHKHEHANTRSVLNRLSRAIGHLEHVRQMVEDGRDCSEVLIQLAAVRSALNSTGRVILKDHIEHCIVDAIEDGDQQAIVELEKAIDQFIK